MLWDEASHRRVEGVIRLIKQVPWMVCVLFSLCACGPVSSKQSENADGAPVLSSTQSLAADTPAERNRRGWALLKANPTEQAIQEGLALIQSAADEGEAKAIYNLAVIHQEGRWIDQDLDKAFDGMLRASRMGLAEAMTSLGFMYEASLGVAMDLDEAAYWYERAATHGRACSSSKAYYTKNLLPQRREQYLHGDPDAQFLLARLHETGTDSISQNLDKARQWYEDAAIRGDAPSQHRLAMMLGINGGLGSDLVTAFAWAKLAVSQESRPAYATTFESIQARLDSEGQIAAQALFQTLTSIVTYNREDLRLGIP